MGKRFQENRKRVKGGKVGKVVARARGALVWSDVFNRKTTKKMAEAIENNKKQLTFGQKSA